MLVLLAATVAFELEYLWPEHAPNNCPDASYTALKGHIESSLLAVNIFSM